MTRDYLPITAAFRATGISRKTIRAAVAAGRVRVVQDGARVKYSLADIRALGERQKPRVLSLNERWNQGLEVA